jgi:class 3 adenylate cyclase/Tfp pilus assembly protein PilF
MRTYDQLRLDVDIAVKAGRWTSLRPLIDELHALDTAEAAAFATWAQGIQSGMSGDNAHAQEFFQQALAMQEELADRSGVARTMYNLATIRRNLGDYPGSLALSRRALQLHEELGDRIAAATVTGDMGTVFYAMGDYEAAMDHCRRAMTVLEDAGDNATLARVFGIMGMVVAATGDIPLSMQHYGQALSMYEELGDHASAARVMGNMGLVATNTGDYAQALEWFHRAQAILEDLHDKASLTSLEANIGNVHAYLGEYPQSLEHYHRALSMYNEIGNPAGVARITVSIGAVYYETGDYPQALEHFRRAHDAQEAMGIRGIAARTTARIGDVYASTGDHRQALEHYERALAVHQEVGDRSRAGVVTGNMGAAYQAMGDLELALAQYQRSLALHEEVGDRFNVSNVISAMVEVLLLMGRDEEASRLLDAQGSVNAEFPAARARQLSNMAVIAERSGDLDGAKEHLTQALSIIEEIGQRSTAADYHRRLRDLAQARNDFAGYIEHNTAFLRITDEIRGQEATRKLVMVDAEKRIEAERAITEQHRTLLYSTLPPAIADRVLKGETVNDAFDHAAVMFMDMVGFTTMSSSMLPDDVVKLLGEIFSACDAIIAKHDLMKIKTIGDSYMSVAFESSEQRVASCEQRVASAALAMLRMMTERFPQIGVRIGIHSGPITAGVIGTERLQYDVWGDTVNVASRMESTGEAGRIHVSEAFANLLAADPLAADALTLTPRGMVEVKGKGAMQTYWLW